jgi:HlyB family type I secretion system ABC transporter
MSSGMSSSEHVLSEESLRVLRELSALRSLPADVGAVVVDAFEPVMYEFGEVIVSEGQEADAFYVIASGSARVITIGDGGEEVSLHVLRQGDYFGEIGLLEETTRIATVRAREPAEAFRLERSVFNALVNRYPDVRESFSRLARTRAAVNFLRLHSVFAALPSEGLLEMADGLEPVEVAAGETVVRAGDEEGPMYLVESGRLRIVRDGADLEYLHAGDFFGELSVLHHGRRKATVEALSACRLLALGPEIVRRMFDDYPEFRERVEERTALADYRHRAGIPLDFAEELLPAEVTGADKVAPEEPAAPRDASAAEELDSAETPVSRAPRRRLPHVYQLDEMDCGAACLAMVTRYFGKTVGLPRIRELVDTSTDGTSLFGISHGAQALGLEARNVRASKSRLDSLPLPAVCHWEGNHWVVLYEVGSSGVRIGDPARGVRRLSREEFLGKWTGYATLLATSPAFEALADEKRDYSWLLAFLRPHRRAIIGATLLALTAAGFELAVPVFTQVIVDDAIPDGDTQLLMIGLAAMLAVLVAMVAATVAERYILSSAAVRIDTVALDFLTGRLLGLPMSYFARRRTGDIERRLAGVRQVRAILVDSGVEGLTLVAQVVAALCLMLVYSWVLTLVYLAVVPLYLVLMRYSARRLRPMFDNLEEAYGRYSSQQIDAIRGIETVKALAAEDGFREQMRDRFTSLAERVFRAEFLVMTYQGAIQLVTILSLVLFLCAGGLLVIDGQLTLGEFVAFNTLVLLTNGPVLVLLSLWDELQEGRILLDRLSDVVEAEPEQGADKDGLQTVRSVDGAVRLRNVGFRYGGPDSPEILSGIDLEVQPGTTVAVVGRSGSGKTTLVKLIAGLLEPTEGSVELDRTDLKTVDYRTARRHIGFVLQDSYLFDDTIARNIAFGEPPDPATVQWAARVAAIHDFVERLPLGYETRVGDSGLRLSGGQAQRIAIARAVYRRPAVLLLDEASSSLDSESERSVQRHLDELMAGRTSIVIAHRLSTVRNADLIVVLDRGRIVERGTHPELMERQGLYYYLVGQQVEE